jgi:hypothetical protein
VYKNWPEDVKGKYKTDAKTVILLIVGFFLLSSVKSYTAYEVEFIMSYN